MKFRTLSPEAVDVPVYSNIASFYSNQTIFITGGSGFVGKVILEKILRCCPKVKKVYTLIRPKKDMPAKKRLMQEIFQYKIFDKIRSNDPGVLERVDVISGDLLEPGLAISDEDLAKIHKEVTIVIHTAATIRFKEFIRFAIQLNVMGTNELVKVCASCQQLKAFVHVSTAFANCERSNIEEVIYPPPVEPQRLLDTLEWMDDEMLELLTPRLLRNKPNTYTYSKHLAEAVVLKAATAYRLPVCVVRPSIVGAAWKEPMAGWIDNFNGPGGFYVAAGRGLLRSVFLDSNAVADIVPVDFAANVIITSAWYTSTHPLSTQLGHQPLVYHCTSGNINPVTWGEVITKPDSVLNNAWKRFPLEQCFRMPKWTLTDNSMLHDYWVFVGHIVPAHMYDFFFRITGQKPQMVSLYKKLHKMMDSLQFFTLQSWRWSHSNTDLLVKAMSPEDRKTFYFDARRLDWPVYIENCYIGTKQFLLNEDMNQIASARNNLQRLRNVRRILNCILIVSLWRILIARSQLARNLWSLIMRFVFNLVRFLRITSTVSSSSSA